MPLQTVASSNVLNVAQLMEACTNHFSGQPCLGYPFDKSEQLLQEFVVSQTPVPRMISAKCKKIIGKDKEVNNVNSCSECLRLEHSGGDADDNPDLDCDWEFDEERDDYEPVAPKRRNFGTQDCSMSRQQCPQSPPQPVATLETAKQTILPTRSRDAVTLL